METSKSYAFQLIIDFEDAVSGVERDKLYHDFFTLAGKPHDLWVRLPLGADPEENASVIKTFIAQGCKRFVLPKLTDTAAYRKLDQALPNELSLMYILLVEHPRLLLELKDILQDDKQGRIQYVSLGSHDLMSVIGGSHTLEQLYFPRYQVLYLARAYGIKAIDIASMNISNEMGFKEEVVNGLTAGYDAKYLLHPRQASWYLEALHDNDLVSWAQHIIQQLPENFVVDEVEPFVLNGQVIEKPHLLKAVGILQKNKKYGK